MTSTDSSSASRTKRSVKLKVKVKLSYKSSVTAKFICDTFLGHTWAVSENNFQHFYHLILEEYRSPLFGSPREDPFHFPLTYCRQCSNMETDALLSILPTCLTISNKHFLLECHLKGHLHMRMEELLQPVDTFGIKVMISIGLTQ